jgi:hypothetical protein
LGVLVVAFALPLIAYAGWFDSVNGTFALENFSGVTFYGRVAPFADCHGANLSTDYRDLCPTVKTSQWPTAYIFTPRSPFDRLPPTAGSINSVGTDFAVTTILRQPTTYAATVGKDFAALFNVDRVTGPDANPVQTDLVFRRDYLGNFRSPAIATTIASADGNAAKGRIVRPLAQDLVDYQNHFYFPGPVFAIALVVAFVGAWFGRRSSDPPLSAEAVLLASNSLLLLLIPIATVVLDFRWLVPALPMMAMSGAIGGYLLFRRVRPSPPRQTTGDRHEEEPPGPTDHPRPTVGRVYPPRRSVVRQPAAAQPG